MTIFLNFLNEELNVIIDECKREEDEIISTQKKKKSEQIDLDELVSYIQAEDDVNKPKKKHRKRGKKQEFVNLPPDKEIEEFKSNLLTNSEMADRVRKIKPVISKDWISKLKQIII
jgi:hypothetical protein